MLVLSRKSDEEVVFPDQGITIRVLAIDNGKVRLGISAPDDVRVYRKEVWERIRSEFIHVNPLPIVK